MKIVIAGGNSNAEFIITMFKDKKNELVIINPDHRIAQRLVSRCKVKVYEGDPWRRTVLEEAGAFDADIFLSLCAKDTDNYASCLMAKKVFNARRVICVVDDPRNVDLYKKLGLDVVISSTYLLAQTISTESTVQSLTKTLSLDDNKIQVVESVVFSHHALCFKAIKDIRFPKYASIAAIYRNDSSIIPNGLVVLKPKDTLMMVTASGNAERLLKYAQSESSDPLSVRKKLAEAMEKADAGETVAAPKPSRRVSRTKKKEDKTA